MANPLDFLTNMTPEQNQALLAAGSQILMRAAPGRQPFSFGQAMGVGGVAFQESMADQQERGERTREREMATLVRGAQLEEMIRKRQHSQKVGDFWAGQGGAAVAMPTPTERSSMSTSEAASTNGVPPAEALAQAGVGPAAAPSMIGYFHQFMQEARQLRAADLHEEADAREKLAAHFRPRADWKTVKGENGEVVNAAYFDDGTRGPADNYKVAEKLVFRDTGPRTEGLNPFTGDVESSLENGVSPDTAARIAAQRERTAFDREALNTHKRTVGRLTYNEAVGGFIVPPSPENPAGAIIPLQGAPGPKLTEFQGKSAAFGLRAQEADKILTDLQGDYSPAAINSKATVSEWPIVGGALGAATNKFALTDNDQKAEQAQRDFINANLRQESGAAIMMDEFDNARKQYFPQPGDSDAVIAQKARNRKLAIQGLNSNAGPGRMTAPPADIPAGAISMLRSNPSLAPEFDAKFGAGAAASILRTR
ncbi:hypothetical protein [Massilia oculi]|uniref:hypothetical protein n=1 Tax=Massilia oculi TaxID=945844 RepID=UPI001AB01B80|nr:hypothetical protein [Massilia oculi]